MIGLADRAPAETERVETERVEELRRTFASDEAFRAFYDAALPRIYGYLFHRCHGDHALAEDLTQATMLEAVRHRGSYDGRSEPLTG